MNIQLNMGALFLAKARASHISSENFSELLKSVCGMRMRHTANRVSMVPTNEEKYLS